MAVELRTVGEWMPKCTDGRGLRDEDGGLNVLMGGVSGMRM